MRANARRRGQGRRHRRAAWLVGLAVVVFGGCDSDSTDPTPDRATVEVRVTADDAARSGVTVELFAAGSSAVLDSEQTGSNGVAAFGGLEAGSYEAEVTVPAGFVLGDGETARRTVTVAAGATQRVEVALVTDESSTVVEVRLTSGLQFDPSEVTIEPGMTVRWINASSMLHTITPDGHSEWSRVEMSTQDQTFEHTFETAGTFPYFCEPHQSAGMTGTITVE
jgi:plastocyanin